MSLVDEQWETKTIPLIDIELLPEAYLPGGETAVSRATIAQLVKGSKEPLLVRPFQGKFQLVAGDLEYWVMKKRGQSAAVCLVREMDGPTAIVTRVSEGTRRKDINPVEEAKLLWELVSEYGMTHQEAAIRCGRMQCTVSNKIRLLRLPEEVLEGLKTGKIGERHARALLRSKEPQRQIDLYRRCVKMKLTANQMEDLCGFSSSARARRISMPSQKGKVIYKDPRIFQNTLRKIVAEMEKAGLDVVFREESYEKSWVFKVLVKS